MRKKYEYEMSKQFEGKTQQWLEVLIMANCVLLLACLLFSFACNLIRKLFDNQNYSDISAMLQHAAISGLAGFFFSLILSEFFLDPVLIITLSGIGGFFGTKTLELIIQARLQTGLTITDELQNVLNQPSVIDSHFVDNNSSNQSSQQSNHQQQQNNEEEHVEIEENYLNYERQENITQNNEEITLCINKIVSEL